MGKTPEDMQSETALQPESALQTMDFNIADKRTEIEQELRQSPEIEQLTSEIVISDLNSIITFGGKVAEDISRASDTVLNSMSMKNIDDSSEMLKVLGKIMDSFDIDEISDKDQSFLGKIFNNARKQLDQILDKYQSMGSEVDKVYVQLKKYEDEIKTSNKNLESLFQGNIELYGKLVKYIVAGERGLEEIVEYTNARQEEYVKTGDNTIQFELTSLEQAKSMLEQRTHDLRIAENVAMQSIPMIKTMQFSNLNLVRKINSAFIITLPVFKQALAQAIMLKRQRIQADALSALDEKTNEMLIKNAQNTSTQSTEIARLANSSSIKIETLEQSWKTIVKGIEDTKLIQEESSRKRHEEVERLNAIKADFEARYNKKK